MPALPIHLLYSTGNLLPRSSNSPPKLVHLLASRDCAPFLSILVPAPPSPCRDGTDRSFEFLQELETGGNDAGMNWAL
jgi:hypothetical protein